MLYNRNMNIKNIITILVVVALAVGAYWLLTSYQAGGRYPEEQALNDADYLLDNSVDQSVNDALNDVLLTGFLDKEALAAEASQLDLLTNADSPSEVDQSLAEVAR